MEISDEELRHRMHAARDLSLARSKPLPPNDHIADSLGFHLVDAGVEALQRGLYWLGVAGMVVIAVVMLVLKA